MELVKLQDEVMMIMMSKPLTRDSDELLYIEYINSKVPDLSKHPFIDVFLGASKYNLASFGSVSRCRRKLQENNAELKGTENTRRHRKELEDEYRQYANA